MDNFEDYEKEKKTINLYAANGVALAITGAAAGDFMVVWILRKEHPETYVQDHPSEAGCFVYRKREAI